MKSFFTILLLIATVSLFGQKNRINSEDLLYDYEQDIFIDENQAPLQGEYTIVVDGGYSKTHIQNGSYNGYSKNYDDKDKLKSICDFFYGEEIRHQDFDPKGNVINEIIFFEIELVDCKRDKKGHIANGKVILIKEEGTRSEEYFIKEGNLTENLKVITRYKNGNIKNEYSAVNGQLQYDNYYLSGGELFFKSIHYSKFDLSQYKELIFGGDFHVREIQIGVHQWTDNEGVALEGKYGSKYTNGNYMALSNYKNGLSDGLDYEFDESGYLSVSRTYKDGVLDGLQVEKSYSSIEKTNYRNGNKHGLYIRFSADEGIVTDSVYYINEEKSGTEKKRYTGGSNDNRNYSETRSYKNGKIHGKVEGYAELYDGTLYLKSIELYQFGKKNGRHLTYDSLGNIIKEENYKFDKLHGFSMSYYEGERSEYQYVLGNSVSHKGFNKEGKLTMEWVNGKEKTVSTEYLEDGAKKINIGYVEDYHLVLNDTVLIEQEYSSKGKLVKETFYLLGADLNRYRYDNFWEYTYGGKGEIETKQFVKKDYPNKEVTSYNGSISISITTGPVYPKNGATQTIKYIDKNGELIKSCQQTYYDKEEYDDTDGVWKKEVCD